MAATEMIILVSATLRWSLAVTSCEGNRGQGQ